MDERKWEGRAAAAGIVFAVLLAVAFLLVPRPPELTARAKRIVTFFSEHRAGVRAGAFLSGLAVVFGAWFVGTLYGYLRRHEDGNGRVSAIAFAGGIGAGAMSLVATMFYAGIGLRAAPSGAHRAVAAAASGGVNGLFLLSSLGFTVVWFPTAVLVAATGMVALRHGALPRAFAIVSLLLGLIFVVAGAALFSPSGFLSPTGISQYLALLLLLLWFLATSILMIVRIGGAAPATLGTSAAEPAQTPSPPASAPEAPTQTMEPG